MNKNTVEIILMCIVLVVLVIAMGIVIKINYMPEVQDVNSYTYTEDAQNTANENQNEENVVSE